VHGIRVRRAGRRRDRASRAVSRLGAAATMRSVGVCEIFRLEIPLQ
jgi:hypothetical protein